MSDSHGQLAGLLQHLAQNSARKLSTFSKTEEDKLKQTDTSHSNQVETNPTPSYLTSNAVVAGRSSQLVKYIGHFCDHGDGTVSDTRTGLMWMSAAVGQEWDGHTCTGNAKLVSLREAFAARRNFAGYNDWRLPTITELEEIVRDTQALGLDRLAFPNQSGRRFWSSSKKIHGAGKNYPGQTFFNGHALVLTLRNGEVGFSDPDTGLEYVRLVRNGLSFSIATTTIGAGDGSVLRSPYADNYFFGSSVTLTAQASADSKFKSWHGDASGQDATCMVTMDSEKTISAEFSRLEYCDLNVMSVGTGSGLITPIPKADRHIQGSTVVLTARPVKGSKFVEWHGDAIGHGARCIVTMDSTKNVKAEFVVLENFSLTIVSAGTGTGSIERSPAAAQYSDGDQVTLTALENAGSKFKCWRGDASGSSSTCKVTMDSTKAVSAEFVALESFPLDVTATGTGSGKIDKSINSPSYFAGTEVTLTALAEEGSIFNGWHGDVTMMDDSITVTMSTAFSISAEFVQLAFADTEISAELVSTKRSEVKRGQTATVFRLILRNNGEQQVRIKVPLTSYVSQSTQTSEQSSWVAGLLNGSKGVTLSAGTFCEMGLVHFTRPAKGDRLYVNVEQIQPSARICFTFQCADSWNDFLLINASLENLGDTVGSKANHPTMASALKRIESLEKTLAEVLRRLDAIQRGSPMAGRNIAPNQAGPVQTLSEVWAWVAEHERICVAELRERLLPLDLLPGAAIDELNERALDLTGEIALAQVGDEIVVTSVIFDEVFANWKISQS